MNNELKRVVDQYEVGVVVARMQVPELTQAHIDLLSTVEGQHFKTILFLGVPPTLGMSRNPLDFQSRKQMVETQFPDIIVLPLPDQGSDVLWSKDLDRRIGEQAPMKKIALYGSRDSFIPFYSGRYPTIELESIADHTGTEERYKVSHNTINSSDFRAGAIWASQNRFPQVFPVVDVGIFKGNEVVVGSKEHDMGALRFVGGFADVGSENYEQDVKREAMEETGTEIGNVQYVGSMNVSDWRYDSEPNAVIRTMVFTAQYIHGILKGNDDLPVAMWKKWEPSLRDSLVPEHKLIFDLIDRSRKE